MSFSAPVLARLASRQSLGLRTISVAPSRLQATSSSPPPRDPQLGRGPSAASAAASSAGASGFGAPYSAGPYPIGAGLSGVKFEKAQRPWNELSTGQKVARGGRKLKDYTVVSIGGVLVFVIFVSVGSELFSPNSPTVIFNAVTKRLKDDANLPLYLIPPFSYHPPHASTSSRRNARTQLNFPQAVSTSSAGVETHQFSFLIEGQTPGDARSPTGWWGSFVEQVQSASRRRWNDLKDLAEDAGISFSTAEHIKEDIALAEGSKSWSSGLFGRRRSSTGVRKSSLPELGTYTTGEAHVICEKNPSTSRLEVKQITVYVPSAAYRNAHRFNVPVGDIERGLFTRAYDFVTGRSETGP